MTEPANNTKTSKIAIIIIFSPAIVAIVALVVSRAFDGRPDFVEVDRPLGLIMIMGCVCSIVFGIIGFIVMEIKPRKPLESNLSIGAIFLGIVLLIIIPNVLRFQARSKQTETKQNLEAIYTAYQSYHSQYDTYPTSPSILVGNTTYNCMNITGWEPKGQLRYTYECEGTQAYYPGWDGSPMPMACDPPIATHATKDSFTIAACGNLDTDSTLDEWTIDDSKHLRNILDDVRK